MFFVFLRVWDKGKILSPHEESSSDLRILRSDALPLSHRDSMVSEAHHEVLMTRVLHTARVMLCTLLILTFDSIARFTHTDYLEYFAPDFSLYPDIAARIENQNTKQVSLMLADSKLNLQINYAK